MHRQKSDLPEIDVQKLDVVYNKGWKCDTCDMTLAGGERCLDVRYRDTNWHPRNGDSKKILCLPCASVFLVGTDMVLLSQVQPIKDRVARIREIQKVVGRETKRRGHIFIGRKLAGG